MFQKKYQSSPWILENELLYLFIGGNHRSVHSTYQIYREIAFMKRKTQPTEAQRSPSTVNVM
jgi:hypothetical protein